MEDCTKVGVRSIDDKRKFMALADDLKQQFRAKSMATTRSSNSNSNNNNAMTTTSPHQSRKRPLKNEKTPPEKHARRMTLSHQTLPRTSISPKTSYTRTSTVTTTTGASSSRRLSYLPRPPTLNRSPIRNNHNSRTSSVTATVSPSRPHTSKTPPRVPKFLEEMSVEVKMDEDPLPVQKQGRHLDAYGIPVASSKQRPSAEGASTAPLVTYEEYLKSKVGGKQSQQYQSTTMTTLSSNDLHQRIRVCVRKRPLSKKETAHGERDVAPVVGARTIQVNAPK